MPITAENLSPNFINPSYATPEQLSTLREYAKQLMTGSGQQKVQRPAQGLSNIVNALVGGYEANRADTIQQQALDRAAGRDAALIAALNNGGGNAASISAPASAPVMAQEPSAPPRAEVPSSATVVGDKEGIARGLYDPPGSPTPTGAQAPGAVPVLPASAPVSPLSFSQRFAGGPDPRLLGATLNDPMVSPEQKAMVRALFAPQAIKSLYGQPGTWSPIAGAQPSPTGGMPFGVQAPVSVGGDGSVTTPSFITGPNSAAIPGLGGGSNTGGNAGAPDNNAGGIDALAAKGRELGAEANRVKSGAEAEGGVISQDVKRAAAAPETLKGLGLMRNTIQSLGDSMTFGPTAKLSNEARRVIANYAPSLVDEKALAGADAIEKLNLGLAGALSQQLGLNPSDIYRSVASVPGNEKSKGGTLALINMMEQAARNDQYVGTTLYQQYRGNLAGYQQARADYYASHPIVNPITGNPVEIDAKKAAPSGPTATGPNGQKLILQNGKWVPLK